MEAGHVTSSAKSTLGAVKSKRAKESNLYDLYLALQVLVYATARQLLALMPRRRRRRRRRHQRHLSTRPPPEPRARMRARRERATLTALSDQEAEATGWEGRAATFSTFSYVLWNGPVVTGV